MLLPTGFRGLILTGLFASLMSSVDSIFNSVSTLWSIDIYQRRLKPTATDREVVGMGKKAIVVTLLAGLCFGFVQVYFKFHNPDFALTHWFNDISYYVKVGFVILIMSAVFLYRASSTLVLAMMFLSIGIKLLLEQLLPEMAYFNITALTIVIGFSTVAAQAWLKNRRGIRWSDIWHVEDRGVGMMGLMLLASVIFLQIWFH
jgi:Na+/proline symporter